MVETTRTTGKTAAEANKPVDGEPKGSPSTGGASQPGAEEQAQVDARAEQMRAARPEGKTHIRFIGHPSQEENSATVVFGKQFYRGKWVPISNLDGGNPDKKALEPDKLRKLLANPAFQVGAPSDDPPPGFGDDGEVEQHEEA